MDSSKLLPISISVAGLGILLFAIAQANKDKNGNAYLNQGTIEDSFNAKEIATVLYDAMKEANFTNTEKRKTIFATLTGVSQAQFSWVIKAFGSRYYNMLTGNTYFALWQTPVKHPLKVWFKEELSDNDYKLLKSNYPKYL
ncbi:hypothetical protein FCR2A7T_23960 [Flavobacterium cauense R2A-7]|uniref:Annexin n=1 Tax=Flavobacterium cauense R2A-7 TaxID=1341154 RepID=V6RY83_9FLAO|nr:hypothetical protein [Flavobacterium cauense]ESU18987.1 hypothetical protein FCR2A7T_23960 [Flavobacterium cauense R2A-7]KGO82378.1 hypothetical protein Q762_06830 [Flavobacterium cauense R2A-7]TWI15352.1 hypothetical protein IP98_00344 [Flavobacterium cauense R2A-7]